MRWVTFTIVAIMLTACSGSDSPTLDEPCYEDSECIGSEKCVRSGAEETAIPPLPGFCRGKNDECRRGVQLDCPCDGTCTDQYPDRDVPMMCVLAADGVNRCYPSEASDTTGMGLDDEELDWE